MQASQRIAPHSSEQLQPGDTLGRYQLLCPIARGGMGQVWAARQSGPLGLPKLVAIKTAIPIESKDYNQVQEYLFDEAQVASSVDHPNVCKILELGQERDVLFIAMEWLNGVPLSSLVNKLPQRRMNYRMAAYLVAQACSGLHAAHELRDDDGVYLEVVHRDATPHNFMITSSGELKVMDFGIVKSKNQQHQATQNGELKGKLSYLAPEQIRGRRVDRRADIFTLGCVLYVITVGKGAFNSETDQDAGRTIHNILSGEYVLPSSLRTDYPPELEAIVVRALATAPEQRYQTAEEMRRALEWFLEDGSRSVSRDDVAALLQEHCGAIIDQRRAEIRSTQRQFDSQLSQLRSGAYPVAERAFDIGTFLTSASQSGTGSVSNTVASEPQPAPSGRRLTSRYRGFVLATVASSVLVLGGLGAIALSVFRQPPSGDAKQTMEVPATRTGTTSMPQPDASQPVAANVVQPSAASEALPSTTGGKSERSAKTSRKGAPLRTMTRAALPVAIPTAPGNESAPLSSPQNSQFSQTLSRKPPRHTIDESDPFGQ
ncbi:MAG: protein kinase [Polyangiaceae bacterium]